MVEPFDWFDAGQERHVLKRADVPHLRVSYDGLIARLAPDEQCVMIHDYSSEPPEQVGGLNSRLNGWSDNEKVPDLYYHDALTALRQLQART